MEEKKIVGIFLGNHPMGTKFSWKNAEERGIGGSELWALKLSEKLSNLGYYVLLFIDTNNVEMVNSNFSILPYWMISHVHKITNFDYFISSRRIDVFHKFHIHSKHNFLMLHDTHTVDNSELSIEELLKCGIDGVIYQSEYQKKKLLHHYPKLLGTKFYKVINGVETSKYSDVDFLHKKNRMVISSAKGRGDKWLSDFVLDRIKEKVPDFEVDVCGGYTFYNEEDAIAKKPYVHILGNLSETELAKRQKEAKLWLYPNTGYMDNGLSCEETFCITCAENGVAKNAIVCANVGCFSDTLNNYKYFVGNKLIDREKDTIENENWNALADEFVNMSIKVLKDDKFREKVANNAYEICKNYDWENVALSFISIFNDIDKQIDRVIKTDDEKIIPCDNQQFMLVGRAYDSIYSTSYYKKTFLANKDFIDTRKFKLEYYTGYDTGQYDNDHHMTTRCFYNIIIPELSKKLNFNFNKNDFHTVNYFSEDGNFNLSYLWPNLNYEFNIKYDNFTDTVEENGGFDILVGVNDTNKNNEYPTNYHRLCKIAHRCGIITNNTIDNDKSILVSGDSHMIPVIPILACYYKTIVFLDNRDYKYSHKYMYDGKHFTDTLFEFFEETRIFTFGLNKPLAINLL